MAEIYFVRHGQPDWYPEPQGLEVDEPGLTELGHLQAHLTAKALAPIHFDRLFVSNLRRARETAQPIAQALGLEPQVIPWFREIAGAPQEGLTRQECEAIFAAWRHSPLNSKWTGPEHGESFYSLVDRLSHGLDSLMAEVGFTYTMDGPYRLWKAPHPDIRLIFVGHSFATSVAVHHLLGLQQVPFGGERFRQTWCAYMRLASYNVGQGFFWRLRAVEERAHLGDLPTEEG